MKKEDFNNIMDALHARVAECIGMLGDINTDEDVTNLSNRKVRDLIAWARQEQSTMDRILGTDLHHIIGMGRLTVTQTDYFLKLMRKYMSFRPDIKALAKQNYSLPKTTEFNIVRLGGVKLQAGRRIKEPVTIKATQITNNDGTSGDNIFIKDRLVYATYDKLDELIELMAYPKTVTKEHIIKVANRRGNYAGGYWTRHYPTDSIKPMIKVCFKYDFYKIVHDNLQKKYLQQI